MSVNSLEKVIFLKRKLAESQNAIKSSSNNQKLTEMLANFERELDSLVQKMESFEVDENCPQTKNKKDEFFIQFNLNRGDHKQERFKNNHLTKRACVEDQISRLTKTLVETIEDENISPELIKTFHQNGIYEILYHHGVIGHFTTPSIYDNSPLGPIIMILAMVGLGFATLSVAFFAAVTFLGLSGGWMIAATALLGSASAYMAGLLYGIINDIFATKANLPYFLLGHQPSQHSFFRSNDPLVQAIGWGIIAAQPIAILAAIVFAITIATVMSSCASPVLTFALPMLLVLVPLFAVCANAYAQYHANQYIQKGISMNVLPETWEKKFKTALNLPDDAKYIDLDKIDFDSPSFRQIAKYFLNDYQLDGLALMSSSKKDKANWLANSQRNLLGYIGTPLLAITGLVLMLTITTAPVVFFSPLLSTIIPIVAAVIAIASLASALTYVSVNQEKQIDNRYKLFTNGDNGKKNLDTLYVTDENLSETIKL